jgi:hypothetical protein
VVRKGVKGREAEGGGEDRATGQGDSRAREAREEAKETGGKIGTRQGRQEVGGDTEASG